MRVKLRLGAGDHPTMINQSVRRFLPAVIFLLTFAGFLPTLWNGFIDWQDTQNLVDNANFRGFGWGNLVWMFTTLQSGKYQPLTWLSFAVDHRLWVMDPFGYHLTSLLIHSVNAALLYIVTLQLLSTIEPRQDGSATSTLCWAAAAAVLLFSLYPMRVEAVAWASARNLLLSTFFLLLALSSYLRAQQKGANNAGYWRWMGLSMASQLLSILCGENGLALPMLLLILDLCLLSRLEFRDRPDRLSNFAIALLEKCPFVALSAIGIYLAMKAEADGPDATGLTSIINFKWVAQILYGPVFYLWKSVFPSRLLPSYDLSEVLSNWQRILLLGGFGLITVGVGVHIARRRATYALVAWVCYLIAVFMPRIQEGVNGTHVLADRYSYFPALVLAIVVAAVLRFVADSWSTERIRHSSFAAGSGLLLILAILTWRQSNLWHDGEKLWRHAVAVDPRSRQARQKLADILVAQNRDGEAIQLYRRAVRDDPDSALAQVDLAQLLVSRGQLDEAEPLYRRALAINGRSPQALFGMGNLLAMLGDFDGAIGQYRKALDSAPTASFVHVNLGYALARRGQLDEAIDHYRRAIRLDSANVNAYFNLAGILATQGQDKDAMANYREALKIVPGHAKAHYGLAILLIKTGNRKEAVDHYQEAIKFEPDQAGPYYRLGIILAEQGQLDSAVAYYRHALGIDPGFAEARLHLARALAALGKKQEALREYEEAKRLLGAGSMPNGAR